MIDGANIAQCGTNELRSGSLCPITGLLDAAYQQLDAPIGLIWETSILT